MSDYPETVREFRAWFPDDQSCRVYLERIRWPDGPRCPRCRKAEVWAMKPPFYRCAACRHDFSVSAGTLLGDTRLPLSSCGLRPSGMSSTKSKAPAPWACSGCWA